MTCYRGRVRKQSKGRLFVILVQIHLVGIGRSIGETLPFKF